MPLAGAPPAGTAPTGTAPAAPSAEAAPPLTSSLIAAIWAAE
jgi:hypothetical protein